MIRRIIQIDSNKCNGCGICASACHEGAIEIVNGKAKLLRDDYCDGLGDCLPTCPTNAITFVEREAAAYNELLVQKHKKQQSYLECPGSKMVQMYTTDEPSLTSCTSQLMQWPCQLKLVPTHAPYFHEASLLIAADCTAFAYASMHSDFMKNKVPLIGCPKLDGIDYSTKLAQIIKENKIKEITLIRMEVPCCGGLEIALEHAFQIAHPIPYKTIILSIDGSVIA